MAVGEAVRLLELVRASGVTVWLDGGWGVDALLEEQTRKHDDLDLVVELAEVPRLPETLVGAGYEQVAGEAPKSFALVDDRGRQVDVHPVVSDDARGGGVYRMDDGRAWVYPGSGFTGRGRVAGPARPLSQRGGAGARPRRVRANRQGLPRAVPAA
jgi:hypothetical protein